MPEAKISSKFLTQLENLGINPKSAHRNLSVEKLVEISTGLKSAMKGVDMSEIPEGERMQERGW